MEEGWFPTGESACQLPEGEWAGWHNQQMPCNHIAGHLSWQGCGPAGGLSLLYFVFRMSGGTEMDRNLSLGFTPPSFRSTSWWIEPTGMSRKDLALRCVVPPSRARAGAGNGRWCELSKLIGKVAVPSLEQKPNHRCPRVRRPSGLAPGFLLPSDAWMSGESARL